MRPRPRASRRSRSLIPPASPGSTIDVHVARLRRRLPVGSIGTVVGVGYRFVLDGEVRAEHRAN